MPDIPVAGHGDDEYDPHMEERMSRVEADIHDLTASTRRLEDTTSRLEHAMVRLEAKLDATLPHLATKAEVAELRADMVAGFADKPSKTYMWGILAVLLTSYACGLAGLAVLK